MQDQVALQRHLALGDLFVDVASEIRDLVDFIEDTLKRILQIQRRTLRL